MHKLILTSQARRDMHQIKEYISRRLQNPIAAKNTLSALIKEFRKLEQFPAMGPVVLEWARQQVNGYWPVKITWRFIGSKKRMSISIVCCMAGRITLRFYLEKIYHRMTEIYNKEATP